MQYDINSVDIKEMIFKEYEYQISMYELAKTIMRITKKPKRQCEQLIGFILEEPYEKYKEVDIEMACCKLIKELGSYIVPKDIRTSIAKVY